MGKYEGEPQGFSLLFFCLHDLLNGRMVGAGREKEKENKECSRPMEQQVQDSEVGSPLMLS